MGGVEHERFPEEGDRFSVIFLDFHGVHGGALFGPEFEEAGSVGGG